MLNEDLVISHGRADLSWVPQTQEEWNRLKEGKVNQVSSSRYFLQKSEYRSLKGVSFRKSNC